MLNFIMMMRRTSSSTSTPLSGDVRAVVCVVGVICTPQSPTPNGDFGVDSMISVLAHELAETGSDPLINAWYDASGNENGDKCAWNFGTLSTAANGAKYNEQVRSESMMQ